MTPLQDLAARLVVPPPAGRAWPAPAALVALVAQLQLEQQADPVPLPADACLQALVQFRASGELATLKQARLACHGLALPLGPGQPTLMEDQAQLDRLLAATDRWRAAPLPYRRLYQGLLHSHFVFDPAAGGGTPHRRAAALRLRTHLGERARATVDPRHNPAWVRLVATSPHLFSEAPAAPYAEALLRGDTAAVDTLCTELGVGPGSWFRRELVAAQLQAVLALPEAAFPAGVFKVLALVARQPLLRDDALCLLMDRWATFTPTRPPHAALLQAAKLSWGEPGAQPPDPRWAGLSAAARTLFAGWRRPALTPAGPDLADAAPLRWPEPPLHPAPLENAQRPEPSPDAHWRTAEAAHLPFNRANLAIFARAHSLPVDDRSARGEGLWVQVAEADDNVRLVLARWGFNEVAGSGWKR